MITYSDKVSTVANPLPDINKVTDDDMNEIKSVVNANETTLGTAVSDIADAVTDIDTLDKKSVNIYNVTKYGLVGDLTTDNSAALTALIAAASAGDTFYFPRGSYYFLTGVTFDKLINIVGDGINSILFTDANITLLNFDSGAFFDGLILRDFRIYNSNAGTPTSASIGLRLDQTIRLRVTNLMIQLFYKNVQLIDVISDSWVAFSCHSWVHTGMERINNTPYKDSGDGAIVNSWFIPGTRNSTYSIFHQNGGGLKITNTKFNWDGTFKVQYHYYYDADGTTVDINISNCSFENHSEAAIRIGETSGNIREVCITSNDIGATSTSGVRGVELSGVDIAVITGNTFKGGSGSSTAISLTNVDNVVEDGNVFDSWTNDISTSGTVTNFRRGLTATSATKTTAGAPYTNDGFVTVNIFGTNVKLMTTA